MGGKAITISFKQNEEDLYNELKKFSSPSAWLKDLAKEALKQKQSPESTGIIDDINL